MMQLEFEGDNAHHINMTEEDIEKLVDLTQGYSGADLKALSAEAAMIPLRSIANIVNVDISNIRALTLEDFKEALNNVKATV